MNRHKILSTGVALAFLCAITPNAMAEDLQDTPSQQEVSSYLTAYTDSLNAIYKTALSSTSSAMKQKARDLGSSTETVNEVSMVTSTFNEAGLDPLSSSSTTKIVTAKRTRDTIHMEADVTTTITSHLKPGVRSHIAPDGEMTSSWTNRHIIEATIGTVGKNSAQNPGMLAFTKDTIVDTGSQPLAASSDICKTRTKASQDSTKLTYAPVPSQSGGAKMSLSKFIQYANKWTSAPYDNDTKDGFNPDFPYYDPKSGNCANFASQSLYAGGMKLAAGNSLQSHSTDVWTWNLSGVAEASRTWQNADYNYCYLKKHTDFSTEIPNIWTAPQGSVMYTDWEKDGVLNHALLIVDNMIVPDGKNNYKPMPVICQKSSNRNMVPMTTWMTYAKKDHPSFDMYGLTTSRTNSWV